jgi:hypothetical protein
MCGADKLIDEHTNIKSYVKNSAPANAVAD